MPHFMAWFAAMGRLGNTHQQVLNSPGGTTIPWKKERLIAICAGGVSVLHLPSLNRRKCNHHIPTIGMFSRALPSIGDAGGGVGVTERSAGDGAGVGGSGALRPGVEVGTASGAGVVPSAVVSSVSAKRFSYQTTRPAA